MKWRIISSVALAGGLACAKDGADAREKSARTSNEAPAAATRAIPAVRFPKVLRGGEPADSRVVMLPGPMVPRREPPPPAPNASSALVTPGWRPKGVPALPAAPEVAMSPPAAESRTLQTVMFAFSVPPRPAPAIPNDGGIALSRTARPAFPAGLVQESAVFCQREIGHWTLGEARALLGDPLRQRAAIDDDSTENGHIFAFRDPTNRYKEFELDFDKEKGILRTVFVYPWNLTWQDCRKLWGGNVSATQGNRGRTFYSYVNRHLDVLVDHDGKVISLGLY